MHPRIWMTSIHPMKYQSQHWPSWFHYIIPSFSHSRIWFIVLGYRLFIALHTMIYFIHPIHPLEYRYPTLFPQQIDMMIPSSFHYYPMIIWWLSHFYPMMVPHRRIWMTSYFLQKVVIWFSYGFPWRWCPSSLAKLVNITPISMVDWVVISILNGYYKPTCNWGGTTLYGFPPTVPSSHSRRGANTMG